MCVSFITGNCWFTLQLWYKVNARPHSVPLGQRMQSWARSSYAEPQPAVAVASSLHRQRYEELQYAVSLFTPPIREIFHTPFIYWGSERGKIYQYECVVVIDDSFFLHFFYKIFVCLLESSYICTRLSQSDEDRAGHDIDGILRLTMPFVGQAEGKGVYWCT